MDNQHKKIKGYRELTQLEIDFMNEVKEKGVELNELLNRVQAYLIEQRRQVQDIENSEEQEAEMTRLLAAEALRWVSISKTDYQTGQMALTRAIAQPGFF